MWDVIYVYDLISWYMAFATSKVVGSDILSRKEFSKMERT
jgi:hypothetical protein